MNPVHADNRLGRRQWLSKVLCGLVTPPLLMHATGCQLLNPCPVEVVDQDYLNCLDQFSFYLSPTFMQRPPKRILGVWGQGSPASDEIQIQFVEEVASKIREARVAEVVIDQRLDGCHCDLDAILHGKFNEYRLLELTTRYNADSLMITRINAINNVWPLSIAATVVLIDQFDAVVLMAADGQWNLTDPDLLKAYESYVRNFNGDNPPQLLDAYRRSPRFLQSFIAWQIATGMRPRSKRSRG